MFDVQVGGSVSLMWYYGDRYECRGEVLRALRGVSWLEAAAGLDRRAFKGLAAGTTEFLLHGKVSSRAERSEKYAMTKRDTETDVKIENTTSIELKGQKLLNRK